MLFKYISFVWLNLVRRVGLLLFLSLLPTGIIFADWPIYKGNIYFTGNNDEIIVKNNKLKWLFQADERVFNPIISEGRVYFLDLKGNVYCLDEEFGKLIWKQNIRKISSRFKAFSRAAGKVKYPLVQGDYLFLTDPIAVYAFDKKTGRVQWARTGMRNDVKPAQGLNRGTPYGRRGIPQVDGIYSDPVVHEGKIYYGTRSTFLSREVRNGRTVWENRSIKSFSGYPTFYDSWILTQSMDYGTGIYKIHCIDAGTGKEIWTKQIQKPLKIFPPVVYNQRVYVPTGSKIFCLNVKSGDNIWSRDYGQPITSYPSFTDRAILFTINNSHVAVINPKTGAMVKRVPFGKRSGPLFVTVRDQIYVAYTKRDKVSGRSMPYGTVKAVNFSNKKSLWSFKTPFPGAVSQPAASGGILFFPAGNYLYAIGTQYYKRIVDGGSGHAVVPGGSKGKNRVKPPQPRMPDKKYVKPKLKMRKMKIAIQDKNKRPLKGRVTIKKRHKGRIIYKRTVPIDRSGTVEVPDSNDVEIIAESGGHIPKKVIINRKDKDKTITLDPIERGKAFVVDNIYFEFNKAYLKKESIDILDKLILILKQRRDLKFEVRGHTDSVGKASYNQKLSERRADSVIEYMIKNGISPERLKAIGLGASKPIASNKTKEGRRKNRRTEFFILK